MWTTSFQTNCKRGRCAATLLATLLCTFAACNRNAAPEALSAEDADRGLVARTSAERGPVRVTVEVVPAVARLSDEPTLTITIDYEQGVQVDKPPFGESIGDFVILDFREPLPRVEGNREVLQQTYRLEPTRTGQLAVWPIAVTFTDARPGGDGRRQTVETEGLTVRITSLLESDVPSLADLEPASGPAELPPPPSYWPWWLAAGAATLAAIGGLVYWLRESRRRDQLARPLTPQELAHRELQKILDDDLAARDVKLFYVELTAVVRRYIERTTGIHAPEQTTEEFLHEVSSRDAFPLLESRRLQHFLESADLVKFAGHEPRQDDIDASVERARAFIGELWSGEEAA